MGRARLGTYSLNVRVEGVQVDKQVNARVIHGLYTPVVLSIRIHMVHANGVHSQFLHQGKVPLALVGIDERILGNELVGNT